MDEQQPKRAFVTDSHNWKRITWEDGCPGSGRIIDWLKEQGFDLPDDVTLVGFVRGNLPFEPFSVVLQSEEWPDITDRLSLVGMPMDITTRLKVELDRIPQIPLV